MTWPSDSGLDDLQVVVDVVRGGTWLRPGRPGHGATYFVAGILALRPEATLDEIGSALRRAGLGPTTWQAARQALEQPQSPRRTISSSWRRRFLGGGAA